MLETLRHASALPLLIALAPGLAAWWSGRRLAPFVDDPALPERMSAERRRNGVILVTSIALLIGSGGHRAYWLPITAIAGLLIGDYPLRRVVFGETWTLGAYLSFYIRFITAWVGFWIVLAAAPTLARLGGDLDWAIAIVCAGLLTSWSARYPQVFRLLLRAAPIPESPVLDRCRAIAGRCGLTDVRFERFDMGGGVFANAFALPSIGRGTVVVSSTLLDRLSEDETVAICAHELAHLEQFTPARLRRLRTIGLTAIAAGALWAPAERFIGVDHTLLSSLLWLAVMVFVLAIHARGRRQYETESDERAVALTGQPEALASALATLHAIAHMPRRIAAAEEQSATHPSLARRIRDVRRAGNAPAPALDAPLVLPSADGRTVITLDDQGVQWSEGDGMTIRLAYARIRELRIDVRRRDAVRLIIAGSDQQRWTFPIATGDIPALQSALDVVDGRLSDAPAAAGAVSPALTRLLAAIAAVLALSIGQVIAGALALAAFVLPRTQVLAAAAFGALGGGATALAFAQPGELSGAAAAVFMACAALLLALLAYRRRHDDVLHARRVVTGLAIASAVGLAVILVHGLDAITVHQAVRTSPAAVVLLAALAGALLSAVGTRRRPAAAAAGACAIALGTMGTPWFLDAFGRDPLLLVSPALARADLPGQPVGAMAAPAGTSRLVVSPDGRWIAARQDGEHSEGEPGTYHVGPVGGPLAPVLADELIFTTDGRFLWTATDERGTAVALTRPGARDPEWRRHVAGVTAATLTLDPSTSRWTLIGWDLGRSIVRASGVVGSDTVDEHRWPADRTRNLYVSTIATDGATALVHETRYDRGLLDRVPPRAWTWLYWLHVFRQQSRLWTMGKNDDGKELWSSRLGAQCVAAHGPGAALLCATFDGTRTRFATVDDRGTRHPLGHIAGQLVVEGSATREWLSGWLRSTPVVLDTVGGVVYSNPPGTRFTMHLTAAGDHVAALELHEEEERISIYRVR